MKNEQETEEEEYITDIVKDSEKLQRKILLEYARSPFSRLLAPHEVRVNEFLRAKKARKNKNVTPVKLDA